jgi:hypothetical protein
MGTSRLSDGFRVAFTSGRSAQPHGAVHQRILAVNHLSGTPRFRRAALVCICSTLKADPPPFVETSRPNG